MTKRLYYDDSYLTSFDAAVVASSSDRRIVYLDQTAFYPTSGGQSFDLGTLNGIPITDVLDEEDRVAHVLQAPLESDSVRGEIDWQRRFDNMQQHSGQHLLSAVLEELFGAKTVSVHMGSDASTVDLAVPSLEAEQIRRAERRANELVCANRSLAVTYEDAAEAEGLRKASERSGTLRIVSIAGCDRSACGGTHVRATGEIGLILIRKLDKIRGIVRLEFLAGLRAAARARADYDALNRAAQAFSSALDEVPALAASQVERAAEADKARRKLAMELAQMQGRELFEKTEPDASGIRRRSERYPKGPLDEDTRARAQSFVAAGKAVFLALTEEPATVMLACSADSGLHAGNLLKPLLQQAGGRGGGNAQLAQGSVPGRDALDSIASSLAAV